MIARLIPGARICTFFVAGSMRMPFSRFVLFDFLGSLLSVSLCLTLGALAAHKDYGAAWAREAAGSAACIAAMCLVVAALIVWGTLALLKGAAKTRNREVAGLLDADLALSVTPRAEFLTQD
jgi:membrane protein DedA with SNARE-associated domain